MRRWAIISAVVFAGCARFVSRPLAPSETAARFEQRALGNPELKTFLETQLHRDFPNWPAPAWNSEMLTLAAFYYSPNLEVARAQWRVSQAETKSAGARPNPTLSVTPEYNFNALSGVTPWLPGVNLDVPIETAGKRGKRIARAQHLSDAARLNLATVAWQVRSNVRASLLDFVAAQRREMVLQQQVALREQLGGRLESQAKAGAIAATELTTSRISLAKARSELADTQPQLAESRVRLADAIGVPVSAFGVPPSGGPADSGKPPEGGTPNVAFDLARFPIADDLTSADARRAALKGRTDILAALAEYAASESALQLEIAKQYPDVHFSPGYQFDQGDNKWHLGLSAELPVLNRNQGPIAEAAARRAESAARFEALQARVIGEIDRAIAILNANGKNQAALQSLAAAQQAQSESVAAQFKAGASDQLDVLNAQLEFNVTALAELDAQLKLHQSLGALEDAVQRPLEANTAPPAGVTASSLKK